MIVFSVPLAAVGGVAGLKRLGYYLMLQGQPPQTLDVLTMPGFVILIGTAVNNAILIVHQSLNFMREDRCSPREAVLRSVRTRVRPIFMTTTTTLFGLMPLVLFPGAGSELYRGLGSVVLGGLLVSTVFTLVLVPTLFSLLVDVTGIGRREFDTSASMPKDAASETTPTPPDGFLNEPDVEDSATSLVGRVAVAVENSENATGTLCDPNRREHHCWIGGREPSYCTFAVIWQADAMVSACWQRHFAGEHASLTHSWMQGALESGLRAIQEVLQRA